MKLKLKLKFIIIIISILTTFGCSAKRENIVTIAIPTLPQVITPSVPGVYHIVKRGETLWRISRNYTVDLEELAEFNKISNACKLEVGQKIFIPKNLQQISKSENSNNSKTDFIWPCKGTVISCFNQNKQNTKNQGMDISARVGTSINASASGNVIFTSENMRGYGKSIIVSHNGNFTTVYTNNQENLVRKGDYVKQGQKIALAGATGRTSQCVLHFELRKNNKPQNPLLYLP